MDDKEIISEEQAEEDAGGVSGEPCVSEEKDSDSEPGGSPIERKTEEETPEEEASGEETPEEEASEEDTPEEETSEEEPSGEDAAEEEKEEEEDEEDERSALEILENDPRIRRHRRKKKAIIFSVCFFMLLILAYIGVSAYFVNHFFFFTRINGVDFSAKTEEQVEDYLEKQVSGYCLTLIKSDGNSEIIRGSDINISYVKGKEVGEFLRNQVPYLWITALWDRMEMEAPLGVEYDEAMLDQAISGLDCMKPENQKEAESAYPEFRDGKFAIVDEIPGTQIDTAKLTDAVKQAVSGFVPELSLEEAECYLKPRLTKDSPEVVAACDTMNGYLGASVTYDFHPYTEVVDGNLISQWISADENMNVTFHEDAVRAYVQSLAEKYDTSRTNRIFTTGYGDTVEVSGGSYGWLMDQEAEYAALIANIQNKENITREPQYKRKAVTHEANDFGNTYAEVDLSNQHMFFFKDGQCVLQSDIVTGNPNKGNGTPQGIYTIAYKERNTILRGDKLPDGTYEYESPVSFWMPFNGGIGFHDATWQSAFGGARYQTYGSHGCVNLPYSVAEALYGMVDAGTPVICHY